MNNQVKVERKGTYQGVPQYGITGQNEITPSRKVAEKWAADEHASLISREAACTCTWEDGDSAVCPIHKDEHATLISRDGWEDDGERGRR